DPLHGAESYSIKHWSADFRSSTTPGNSQFPDSSMVEQPAVNRFVVGSSPTRGAEKQDRKDASHELTANAEVTNLGVAFFPQFLRDCRREDQIAKLSAGMRSYAISRIRTSTRQKSLKLSNSLLRPTMELTAHEGDLVTRSEAV